MSRSTTDLRHDQRGFASIVIALVLIIVLALLTVGFAQLARREQQNALDKQLANQANYAAETGWNDAYNDILSGAINTSNASDSSCMKAGSLPTQLPATALSSHQTIDSNNGVSYTCLLVTLNTKNIVFQNVSSGTGKHMTFDVANGNLNTLTISWGSADSHNTYPNSYSATKFRPADKWQNGGGSPYPPVIQVSLTPTNAGALDDATLTSKTFSAYLYPSSASYPAGSVDVTNPANQTQVIDGNCSGTGVHPCKVTFSGLNGQHYLLRFIDYYDTSNILATGTVATGTGSTTALFQGEPIIDVTGKAQDVLKRLQVRMLIHGGNNSADDNAILPNNAIEAGNVCKRIQAAPVTADNSAGSRYDTGTSGSCDLSAN